MLYLSVDALGCTRNGKSAKRRLAGAIHCKFNEIEEAVDAFAVFNYEREWASQVRAA